MMNTISSDEEEEDAWSYSFPPSTDALPLPNGYRGAREEEPDSKAQDQSQSEGNPFLASNNQQKDSSRNASDVTDSNCEGTETKESSSDTNERHTPLSINSSISAKSLQGPSVGKSTPANPQMTKEDANSIISRDSQTNSALGELEITTPQLTPLKSPISSPTSRQEYTLTPKTENKEKGSPYEESSNSRDKDSNVSSPKIISYRKSKRSISEGNFQSILDKSKPIKEKFDPKLYVDEFYKQTNYRYATLKRNTEYHQLFRSIDLTDRLLDDFSCALSREILLQGRIYISETHVCFNSNLLGWVNIIVISQEEIVKIEKKTTAGLFPNGITIETSSAKYNFASFISRDVAFEFIRTVWLNATNRTLDLTENEGSDTGNDSQLSQNDKSEEMKNSEDGFKSYILSVDGDDDKLNDSGAESSNESEDIFDSVDQKHVENNKVNSVRQFKTDIGYINMGPDVHLPSSVPIEDIEESNEIELCNETIDAPLGVTFDILFGSSNTAFHKGFLERHGGSEISDYDKFHPSQNDSTRLERIINYKRALGYSVGPKSTKCELRETIQKLNFNDYIVVLTSTSTPDVPSGNSFTVKTRYCFSWAKDNSTNLRISYFIDWSGTSWIKSVIEKSALSGQKETTKDLIEELKEEVENVTFIGKVAQLPSTNQEIMAQSEAEVSQAGSERLASEKKDNVQKLADKESFLFNFCKNNLSAILIFLIAVIFITFILQMQIYIKLKEYNSILNSYLIVNKGLVSSIEGLASSSGELDKLKSLKRKPEVDDIFWDWVNRQYGRELSILERIQILTTELNQLYEKQLDVSADKQVGTVEEKLSYLMNQASNIYKDDSKIISFKESLKSLL